MFWISVAVCGERGVLFEMAMKGSLAQYNAIDQWLRPPSVAVVVVCTHEKKDDFRNAATAISMILLRVLHCKRKRLRPHARKFAPHIFFFLRVIKVPQVPKLNQC